ncbi:MAG: tetratricopeptide repeat protein [Candidatus Eremiobacteraeota bacterium]|nr:tetratricopeptide repeat protein [Candidatus Eremiobacteraeota bacterium]MBV9737744.1 tetratricopeptide repeat protein [Candidatus Eremiobacteraeota bacterium]
MGIRKLAALTALALLPWLAGCAGPIERWIVDTRVHQGDAALEQGSLSEAELAYRLALKVDPTDSRARTGFSLVATDIADEQFKAGRLDDALVTLSSATKYDPQNVRLQELRSEIEAAKLKREIIVSNYPTFKETGSQITHSYLALKLMNQKIIASLSKFNYNFNVTELTKAIRQSYELNLEVARNTNRLIAYRQLLEQGVPGAATATEAGSARPTSLLPLP